MGDKSFNFCKAISEELDPEKLQRKFLSALLELQNVERGSIWVRTQDTYTCIEAAGAQSERIRGMSISSSRPSIVGWVIDNGKMTVSEPEKDVRHYKQAETDLDVKSRLILCFPLFLRAGGVYGAVQLIDTSAGGNRLNLDKSYLDLLQHLIDIGSIALSNSLVYSDQVRENVKLRQTLEAIRNERMIVGKSPSFQNVIQRAGEYARTDFPVLITGESGTGKELIARELHRLSNRSHMPFLVQNCSCLPDTLLESELFGYRRGAFTGANQNKIGLFEAADGGTVFLDEIGDMPAQLQARILRVVQENEIKPLGETRVKKVDVRIVSATNRDLRNAIEKDLFREDLFYRLNVLPIHVPALRERPEDIHPLLDHFLTKEALRLGISRKTFTNDARKFLGDYSWPGNVRELENFVKHILVITHGECITLSDLAGHFPGILELAQACCPNPGRTGECTAPEPQSSSSSRPFFDGYSWEQLERDYVIYLLEKNKWHVTKAAKEAGVNRSTFDSRIKKLQIEK